MTGKHNNDPKLKDAMRKFKIYASKIEYEEEEDEQKDKPKVNYSNKISKSFFECLKPNKYKNY